MVADCVAFKQHNGSRLLYHCTYILCQINNVRIAKHAAFLATGARFAHWSTWSDTSEAAGQSWQIQELFLHRSRVTQESCGTEMAHYTKKHMVDYCSACGVVHVVVQCTLHHECLQEKRMGAERWDICTYIITTTSAKQANDDTLEVMTNKWKTSLRHQL